MSNTTNTNINMNTNNLNSNTSHLMNRFQNVLTESNNTSKKINKDIKVGELKEIQEEISKLIHRFNMAKKNKKQSFFDRMSRLVLSNDAYQKIEAKKSESTTQHKSVNQITANIIKDITSRKDSLVSFFDTLQELMNRLEGTHKEFNSILEEIQTEINTFENDPESSKLNRGDILRFKMLEKEVRINYKNVQSNYATAQGATKLVENILLNISSSLPIMEAQLNNTLAIRGVLQELEDLDQLSKDITNFCEYVQKDSIKTIESQIVNMLSSTVVSDEDLKKIEGINTMHNNLINNIQAEANRVEESRDIQLQRLREITSSDKNLVVIENLQTSNSLDQK